jgi:hypothetical protein
MYRDREFPGSAIFVTWLKVTNNIDCGVQITRMAEPRIFDVENDRIRERSNPGMTEPGKFGLGAYLVILFICCCSSVTYPRFWRCHYISHGRCRISRERCGCGCGGCASLKEILHLQWWMTASPVCGSRVSSGRCGGISKILDM